MTGIGSDAVLASLMDIVPGDVEAVTFDVGGTLIEPWPSVGHVYAQVAALNGLPGLDPLELTRRFREAWRLRTTFTHTRAEWAALVDATFCGTAALPPSQTFFDELYARFTEAGSWRIFDDVEPTLRKLRLVGLKLGIISNWDDRLPKLLSNLNLHHWFDVLVVSCDVGAQKPARALFDRAANALGIRSDRILHVGDEPEADLHGASAAGFRSKLLVRQRDGSDGDQ